MLKAGVLADTHISVCTPSFLDQTRCAFADCDVIIHAGDLTDYTILSAFDGKTVHAVHGNMCNLRTKQALPFDLLIDLAGYSIGITHGAGHCETIEDRVWNLFSDADCIIFGHTHTPLCEHRGSVLMINPGSFKETGAYGAPATYGILVIDENGLRAAIHTLPEIR